MGCGLWVVCCVLCAVCCVLYAVCVLFSIQLTPHLTQPLLPALDHFFTACAAARGHPHGLKPLGDARRLSLISGGMQSEAALALEFERLYLRLSSAFVSHAAMCSGGKAYMG